MELRVNLDDREEVAAAAALLEMILNEANEAAGTQAAGLPAAVAAARPGEDVPALDNGIPVYSDPAAVFGGAPAVPLAPATGSAVAATGTAAPSGATMPATSGPVSSGVPAVTLDRHGLPWDERIHASTKATLADGGWKKKRGVGETYVCEIEAQLRAQQAQAPAASGVPAAAAVVPTVPPAVPLPPAAPAAPSAAVDPTTFEQIMPRVTAAVTAGALQPMALQAAVTAVGLVSIVALQANPAYVPSVWATLKAQNPAAGL